jgi:hydrogenase maturation protease
VYGYGNPGRQDDGLGTIIAESVDEWCRKNSFQNIRTDCNYQLNLEDAANISEFDMVIFVDATTSEEVQCFHYCRLAPSDRSDFTMHAVAPAYVLFLCRNMFDKVPEAFMLSVRGYEWEFMKEMTPAAHENYLKALLFLKDTLQGLTANRSTLNSFKL